MAKLNISQAAKASGKSRSTIQRHIKNGKLSTSQGAAGNIEVDTAELLRVFGELKQNDTPLLHVSDALKCGRKPQHDTGVSVAIETLKRELERAQEREVWLQKQVDERDDKIKRLEERNEHLITRLLPAPAEESATAKSKQGGFLKNIFNRKR